MKEIKQVVNVDFENLSNSFLKFIFVAYTNYGLILCLEGAFVGQEPEILSFTSDSLLQ